MTPDQYAVARQCFHEAVDADSEERARRLEGLESSDIRREVERLLELHESARTFLDEPLFEAAQTISPGETIGRFRIVRALARGGMGQVFEAEDTKFNQRYAIKTIAPEWLDDRETVSRFEIETKIGRELNHPNICRVYEYLEERRGRHLLGLVVMELVDGETLEAVVNSEGPLPHARVAAILAGILDGLEAAHKGGVIHRDLKPGNVMIQPSGRVVLMDFGLAKHAGEVSTTRRLRGTASYMAPEQHSGESSFRSDIYSLGLVVHFMLTARRSQAEGRIPRAWREAIRKCTAMVPAERYREVAEVRRAFFPQAVWTRRGLIAAGAATLGSLIWWNGRPAVLQIASGTQLVLYPLENRTGDPSLDVLGQVIGGQLEQSPRLRLVEGNARPGAGLSLLAELSGEREAFRLKITLRDLRKKSKVTHEIDAKTRADLFPMIYEACRWARLMLGESAQDMAELDLKPESATTNSWDALMAYTRAEQAAREHRSHAALFALSEALRLDPKFALASMRRGDIFSSLGRDGEALEAWRQTIQLAAGNRLTRLEDFRIRSMFSADTWDYSEALKVYDSYVAYYPHDHHAWHYRATPLLMLDRGQEAIGSVRKAIEIEPADAGSRAAAGLYGSFLGHPEMAREHLAVALKIRPSMAARVSQLVAFIEGRYEELAEWNDRALAAAAPEQQGVVRTQQAHILAELGRWEDSERMLSDGIAADLQLGAVGEAQRKRLSLLAVKTRLYGRRWTADLAQLVAALGEPSGPWARMIASSALARAGFTSQARSVIHELENSFPAPLPRYALQRTRGEILVMEGHLDAGVGQLEKVAATLPAAWPREFLGWAFEKAGRKGAAAAEYRRVMASKGILWISVYLERPGIWADSLERLVAIDPTRASDMAKMLKQIRKKGDSK
jgi:tetratricopeptide (TPR) repeat protein